MLAVGLWVFFGGQHEEMALRKYTELEQTLRKDHRLRILYGDQSH